MIATARLICLCSNVLAIPPGNLRVAYCDHCIQMVRLKVKSGYVQLKTNCKASEPLKLQLYVLVQQRPLTKETLFYWKQKCVMERFLMKMGMSCRESQDGDLQRNRCQMWSRTWKSDAVCVVTFYQTVDGLVTYSYYKPKPLDHRDFYLYFLIWRCIVSCFGGLFQLFWSVLRQM